MGKSTTWMVSMEKLADQGTLGSVMIRLMMMIQDFALANHAMEAWKNEPNRTLASRKVSAARYFLRMQMSHLLEACQMIQDEFEKNADLKAAVEACDAQTKSSYAKLLEFLKGADYTLLLRVRNNIGFHYGDKVVQQSLARLGRKREKRKKEGKYTNDNAGLTLGNEALDWYFQATEHVENDVIIHGIFALPEDDEPGDVQKTTDDIVMRLHGMAYTFADFAGHFVRHHTKA
jgi:hypothetical protein